MNLATQACSQSQSRSRSRGRGRSWGPSFWAKITFHFNLDERKLCSACCCCWCHSCCPCCCCCCCFCCLPPAAKWSWYFDISGPILSLGLALGYASSSGLNSPLKGCGSTGNLVAFEIHTHTGTHTHPVMRVTVKTQSALKAESKLIDLPKQIS